MSKTITITDNTWQLICRARQLGNGKNLPKYQAALHAAARALIEESVKPGLAGYPLAVEMDQPAVAIMAPTVGHEIGPLEVRCSAEFERILNSNPDRWFELHPFPQL